MFRVVYDLQDGGQIQELLTEQEIAELQNVAQSIAFTRSIDARRLRLALHQLDLLVTVEQAIATLGKAAQIDWEYATEIKENYPLVLALAANLGLDTEAIFTLAISLD